MDYTNELLNLCYESIVSDDIQMLQKTLTLMQIERLNAIESSQLLETLLQVCVNNNKTLSITSIFDEWELKVRPVYEDLEFYSSLFLDTLISQETLNFLAKTLVNYSFLEIAQDVGEQDRGKDSQEGAMRIYIAYPGVEYKDVKVILEYLENVGNQSMSGYFERILNDLSNYSEIPSWINNVLGKVPTEDELFDSISKYKIEQDDTSKIIDLIADNIINNKYIKINTDKKQLKDKLEKYYDNLDETVRNERLNEEYVKLGLQELQYNDFIFRVYGPCHPGQNYNSSQLKLGGPRMLMNGEWDYDDDGNTLNWFTGNCKKCHNKIKYYFHAVRRPFTSGGWKECYCSIKCLRREVEEHIENNNSDPGTCVISQPDLYTRNMIDLMEYDLNKIGIQDRTL
jgi:hypothetical protein